MTTAERLADVRRRLGDACAAAGRDPSEVTLVAVSKVHPADRLAEALHAGQVDFGESYAQELRDKAAVLDDGVRWHFIGRLQTNKAKYIAPVAHRVHALTSHRQVEALVRRAPGLVRGMLAVNLGDEDSKSGVPPEHVPTACAELAAVEGFELTGLMTLPPRVDHPDEAAPYFEQLADLALAGRRAGFALEELSMGMSGDFEVAVRYGATHVRIGTAIFGPRPV
ncbi:MAG: YggS family pyridoxal phosphate-dependent enzyme [Myxococcota bacterium]